MTEALIRPFDARADWPLGDSRLLNDGARAAPALPLEALGPLAPFVCDLAEAKGGPADYLVMALLTTAAGVVGAARSVQIRPNWTEPCALWGLLVGNPSTGKSQCLDLLVRAARQVETAEGADFPERERAWLTEEATAKATEENWRCAVKEASKNGRDLPPRPDAADIPLKPERPRIVIGNATVEKLGRLFGAHPRGLLLMADEGAAWFGNFGKYGGDGDAAFYLSAFNGIGTIVDRVKDGGSVAPERALLSACVGIQPERLSELLLKGRADDGLVSRFLPAWPDPIAPVWQTPLADERRIDGLLRRLRGLEPARTPESIAPLVLPLAPEAEPVFAAWWVDAKVQAQAASGLTAGFLGKGLGVVGRLALVIELLCWAWEGSAEPKDVSALAVARAIELFESYFRPMAARVYGDAARPTAERAAVALLREIRFRRSMKINARQVRREWCLPGLRASDEVEAAIAILVDGDWLLPDAQSTRDGGRPRSDYLVNPHLLGKVQ